jgi:hypothetical protein
MPRSDDTPLPPETITRIKIENANHQEYAKVNAVVRNILVGSRNLETAPLRIVDGLVYIGDSPAPVPLPFKSGRMGDALAFLGEILRASGNWRSSPEIARTTDKVGVRFDLIYQQLPDALKDFIESRPGAGYRLA